jgi:hypothetical protein
MAGLLTILGILIIGRPLETGVAKILGINRSSELDTDDDRSKD